MRKSSRTSARRGGIVAIAAIVVVTLFATSTSVFALHDFPDVPNTNDFHHDISWMADKGIADGFADGGFHPSAPVSRQAMSAFMHRLYDILFPRQFSRGFHLFVHCAATTRWAVIASNGSFVRGSASTTSTLDSAGTYAVTFNTNVSACSYQVTVGTTSAGGATTGWATVAASAVNANRVHVYTYDAPQI